MVFYLNVSFQVYSFINHSYVRSLSCEYNSKQSLAGPLSVFTFTRLTMLLVQNQEPRWLQVANISTSILLLITVAALAIHTIFGQIKAKTGKIRLPDAQITGKNRKDHLNEILLLHVDHSLSKDGDPVNLTAFWKQVSLIRVVGAEVSRRACTNVSSLLAFLQPWAGF